MAGRKRKGKGKAKKSVFGNDITSLLGASDFSDFHVVDYQDSARDNSPEELDSDTEDAIYAQMYFNSSSDVRILDSFSKDREALASGSKKGDRLDGDSVRADGMDVRLRLHSQESSAGSDQSEVPLRICNSESASSQSPGDRILEFSFRENSEDKQQQKKKNRKRKKSKSTSRATDRGQTESEEVIIISDSPDHHLLDPSGQSEAKESKVEEIAKLNRADAEVWDRLAVAKEGPRASNTLPTAKGRISSSSTVLSSPEADIKYLFDSSKKPSKLRSKSDKSKRSSKSSRDHDDESSLEQGEISSSGTSSPAKGAGSADMDISSAGEGKDDEKDPWNIIEKDRLGREPYDRLHGKDDNAGRYYGKQGGKCQNCKQRGHASKKCPWPKRPTVCYLCAITGHVSSSCPQALCSYCYQRKHRGRRCSVHWTGLNTECMRCRMFGHHASICPDQWRQYHHTLYDHPTVVETWAAGQRRTDEKNIYCSNCSKKGHFGFECSIPVPRGTPKHHLPLISYHDFHVWPPRDGHSICIIQHALRTRPPPTLTPAPATPHPMPHPPEAQDRKRKNEESASTSHSNTRPPPKKRRRLNRVNRDEKKASIDLELSSDVVSISSDELEDAPLLITVSGHSGSSQDGERTITRDRPQHSPNRPPSLFGNYHRPLLGNQHSSYNSSSNYSFSASPFANMNSRNLPGNSSPLLDNPPFPRTPLSYHDSGARHHQHRQRNFFDHQHDSRRDSTGMYSTDESPHWKEEPRSKWQPPLPPLPPPVTPPPPPPPQTPPPQPDAMPSRSYSTGLHQLHPPAYHRRHSEPAFKRPQPSFKNSTPTSRRDSRNEEYMISERGFRMSGERAREVGYDRYGGPRDISRDPNYQRRYNQY